MTTKREAPGVTVGRPGKDPKTPGSHGAGALDVRANATGADDASDRRSGDASAFVERIADIFVRRGADSYLGEAVTMSQHMLQAATLAEAGGAPDAIVVAALLHDVGHYVNEFPPESVLERDNRHEAAGAALLARWLPAAVVDCVRWHVEAKRFLCATEPDYFAALSPASVRTLELQGGPLDARAAADFARRASLDAILQVRRWDDAAKDPAARTPEFRHFEQLLRRVVHAHAER